MTAGERERDTPLARGERGIDRREIGGVLDRSDGAGFGGRERPETAGAYRSLRCRGVVPIAAGTANATTSASQRGQDMFGTTTVTGMNVAVGRTVGELVIACGPSVQSRGGEVVRLRRTRISRP